VKCDLCRDYEAPACVQACPTESILRLEPNRDFAEVIPLLGRSPSSPEPGTGTGTGTGTGAGAGTRAGTGTGAGSGAVVPAAALLALAATPLAFALHAAGRVTPARGAGLLAGIVAGIALLALAGYAVPKRIVRLWMRVRPRGAAASPDATARPLVPRPGRTAPGTARRLDQKGGCGPSPPPRARESRASYQRDQEQSVASLVRSRTRPWLVMHLVVGALAVPCVVLHAGARLPASPAGLLNLGVWLTALLGCAGAVAYRVVPRRLTRLERHGVLPEELRAERAALLDRLYRETTGRTDLVKAIADHILVPYARRPAGWLLLLASGRGVADEERRLRQRIDEVLAGRGADKLAGVDALTRTVVDLRAVPARRALTGALRAWLPLHIAVGAIALLALVAHVALAVTR
jgi:hypothetical protein